MIRTFKSPKNSLHSGRFSIFVSPKSMKLTFQYNKKVYKSVAWDTNCSTAL